MTAALDAAHGVDPDGPVVTYLLEHDAGSRRRAQRPGLSLVCRGPDAGTPDPDAVRPVHTDRLLDAGIPERIAVLGRL